MGSFMENFAVMSAFALGLFGSVFSVVQFFYQRYKDKEQAAIEAARDKAQDEREAARDKAQDEREAARDKAQAERDKAQAERDKAQDVKDRLFFLAQLIVDQDIPRESRQIFFDEYIAKGGNGSFVKWWLENR
jgi:regulator of protease activity HflC (stomatin/prohibitin superfamily)